MSLTIPTPNQPWGNWTNSLQIPTYPGMAMGVSSGGLHNDSSDTPIIMSFDVVDATCRPYGTKWNLFAYDPPTAQQCGLWLCLQARQIQTVNGSQTETIVVLPQDSNQYGYEGSFVMPPTNIAALNSFFDNNTFGFTNKFTDGLDCGLTANNVHSGTLNDNSLFTGSIDINFASPNTYVGSSAVMIKVKQQLNITSDLNPWIQRVAKSLTNTLLANAANLTASGNATFVGTVQTAEAIFEIRWAWLTLPIAMVVLSSIFLLLIIIKTARAHVPTWKGSPLALLFCGVDKDIVVLAEHALDRANEIVEKVGRTPMALRRDETGGWSFSKPFE